MDSQTSLQYQGPFAVEVYREWSPGMRRRFTLQPDRLIIEGRIGWQSEFEMPVSLHVIDPVYGIIQRRSAIAGPGALILGAMFAFLTVVAWFNGRPAWFPIGATIDALLAVLCVVTGFRYLPKTEYYSFQRAGGGVAFDVGRRGPDRERFEQFVGRVIERVKALQQTDKPDQPPPTRSGSPPEAPGCVP
jgi:hypothetical protein